MSHKGTFFEIDPMVKICTDILQGKNLKWLQKLNEWLHILSIHFRIAFGPLLTQSHPVQTKAWHTLKIMPHPVCLMHRGEFSKIASAHRAGEVYSQVPHFLGKLSL